MKRIILTVLTVVVLAVQSASAMSYERASAEARFLTDKMAYELNLDDYQYQQAYDINFNYFYNLNDASDFYGGYWHTRNSALELIFSALQFRNFCRASYFYRPVYIYRSAWTFPIYRRYSRNRFFRPAPPRPPRPRPGYGNRFKPAGRPTPPRPGYDRPRENRPGYSFGNSHNRPGNNKPQWNNRPDNRPNLNNSNDRRNFNNSSNRPDRQNYGNNFNRPSTRQDSRNNRPDFSSRSNRGNFQPSARGNNRRNENNNIQMKRVENKGSFGRIRRM